MSLESMAQPWSGASCSPWPACEAIRSARNRLAPSLGEFYARLMSGEVRMGTAEGYWQFGVALLNEID
ncbi:MAG: hypothetical protein ACYCW6_23790 [Candidatus Xenobia bacterium]